MPREDTVMPYQFNVPLFILQDVNLDHFNKLLYSAIWNSTINYRKFDYDLCKISQLFLEKMQYIRNKIKQLDDLGYIKFSKNKDRIIACHGYNLCIENFEEW